MFGGQKVDATSGPETVALCNYKPERFQKLQYGRNSTQGKERIVGNKWTSSSTKTYDMKTGTCSKLRSCDQMWGRNQRASAGKVKDHSQFCSIHVKCPHLPSGFQLVSLSIFLSQRAEHPIKFISQTLSSVCLFFTNVKFQKEEGVGGRVMSPVLLLVRCFYQQGCDMCLWPETSVFFVVSVDSNKPK